MVIPNLYSENQEYMAFVGAVLEQRLEAARGFLDRNFNVNCANTRGWTALHFAVENMLVEAVRFLLENGADPNQVDTAGQAPLHIAIDVDRDYGIHEYVIDGKFPSTAKLTALLLERGADPNAKAGDGRTPLELARGYTAAEDALRKHGARNV